MLVLLVGILASGASAVSMSRRAAISGSAAAVALPAVAVAAPETTRIGRGMRAVGTPNTEGVDIDAALGIAWGGSERCDAAEVSCGTNGAVVSGAALAPPPEVRARVTTVAELDVSVANRDEGTLRIGLFGEAAPLSSGVFAALAEGTFSHGDATPAGFTDGGTDFIIRSPFLTLAAAPETQELAYRRREGLRKTPEDFAPSRPNPGAYADPLWGASDQPGLLTVKQSGPGPRLEFALQTAPVINTQKRLVVGALLDADSMRVLRRLATVPVVADRAALGGKAGKPIVKLLITDARVYDEPPF